MIEGIRSRSHEAYDSPQYGWVGNEWAVTVFRIIPEDEVGQWDRIDVGDAKVELLLEGTGLQRDRLVEQAGVHDEEAMQRMLAALLPLLENEPAVRSESRGPGDPRVPQDFPPLAPPEGGEGNNARSRKHHPGDSEGPQRSGPLRQHRLDTRAGSLTAPSYANKLLLSPSVLDAPPSSSSSRTLGSGVGNLNRHRLQVHLPLSL